MGGWEMHRRRHPGRGMRTGTVRAARLAKPKRKMHEILTRFMFNVACHVLMVV